MLEAPLAMPLWGIVAAEQSEKRLDASLCGCLSIMCFHRTEHGFCGGKPPIW